MESFLFALGMIVAFIPEGLLPAVTLSLALAVQKMAKEHALVKKLSAVETLGCTNVICSDKTGTLTEGRPQLTDIIVLDRNLDAKAVLKWAAAAEAGSEHPLARPILDTARDEDVAPTGVPGDVTPVPGKGIVSDVDGRRVLVGNAPLLEQYGIADDRGSAAEAESLAGQGRTPMIIAVDESVIGVIGVADQVREDAGRMVARLHDAGVTKVVMLTGDTHLVAEAIGRASGIDEIHASLLPEDKLDAVAGLQREGHTVAMVGDGVNDAPALATADIGVAMGAAGSAVAVETADIALMGDDLLKLPEAVGLAKRTVRVMKQNIVIALATVVILLIGVFAGGVTMSAGMLVHEGSVLVVILNAMRLLRNGRDATPTATTEPATTTTINTTTETDRSTASS